MTTNRHAGGGGPADFFFLLIVYLIGAQPNLACILLLNGWEPLPLSERTALADIIITVYTRNTYKSVRTEANTYTAEFSIRDILKGRDALKDVSEDAPGNVYNITNFGDKTMCYADVNEGETYILFLTRFDGRLSAKYDDLFGAAAEYSIENEEQILSAIGWQMWSDWTGCSRTCGGGIQSRRRSCKRKNPSECEGPDLEHRRCNFFGCKGVKNLLVILGVNGLPPGVKRLKSMDRRLAYYIDHTVNINGPTSRLFSRYFPQDFSVIVTARPKEDNNGFLFTISDLLGFVKFGVQVGTNPILEYADSSGLPGRGSPRFPVNLSDGNWQQFAYSVRGRTVTMYRSCKYESTKVIQRRLSPPLNSASTVISLAKTFIERSKYPRFEGDVEQLLVIPDPDAAQKQCESRGSLSTELAYNNGDTPERETSVVATTPKASHTEVIWSAWSSCSATCGTGKQTRTAYCADNRIDWDDCVSSIKGNVQSKTCYLRECPATCAWPCYNGGVCKTPGRCQCVHGYYGRQCERVTCSPGCYNGGYCHQPNICRCQPGFRGRQCEQARCHPPCQNGGRCIRPGVCSCPYGYLPPHCKPFCSVHCYNGGTCIGFNYCQCRQGYAGPFCGTAICEQGCGNAGRCVAPNTCICAAGYTGTDCQKPICVPECLNGGTCLYPYFCLCSAQNYGTLCEKFMCSPRCFNGGTCIGFNTCMCPPEYSGRFCQINNCPVGCDNGGKCVAPGRCRCKMGYYGPRCERKKCKYQTYKEPYMVSLHRPDTEEVNYRCGTWGWRTCTKTKTVYKVVYRTFYRTYYRCR